jgi:UDP-glucose 4-epimerase
MNIVGLYGASGFIGSHFKFKLRNTKGNSFIYELPHRGSSEELKAALEQLDALCDESTQACILYLAENNEIGKANECGQEYIKKNIQRLKFIISNTKLRIIYASSAAVYGDLSEFHHYPSDKPNAINIYSKSKLECEKIVLKSGGIVARLSNIYGLGMSKKNIISDIIKQIKNKDTEYVKIIDGTPVRDMIHISDVTSCLLSMTKIQDKGIFNVASGNSISMKNLALIILEIAKLDQLNLVESNSSEGTSCISLDISNTVDAFAWSPQIMLRDGLKELI